MISNRRVTFLLFIVLTLIDWTICSVMIKNISNLNRQSLEIKLNSIHQYPLKSHETHQSSLKIIKSQTKQTQLELICKQNFIFDSYRNRCYCPTENDFTYVSSTDQCKCYLGQVRINERGVKICQTNEQNNLGVVGVGIIVLVFIICAIIKCCNSEGNSNQPGYKRQQSDSQCCCNFLKCLCLCLASTGNNNEHHNHHHKHHGHHHNHHKHHHNHHKNNGLLGQQS